MEWFTTAELAGQTGLPADRKSVLRRAKREGWTSRERIASGGGREYHISSLPAETRATLLLRQRREANAAAEAPRAPEATPSQERSEALWSQWERKTDAFKDEAERRFDALLAIEELVRGGTPRMEAYQVVAEQLGDSVSTIRGWVGLVKGVHQGDWIPLLTPRWTGRTAYAEYDERIYQWFRDQYLHLSKPPATVCYERTAAIAKTHGLAMPSYSTLMRDIERREDPVVIVLEREGEKAAAAKYPYLERDRSVFHAMEALNADGHVLDIDTVWPDGERCRTTMIAFQDLHSDRIVGYRLAKSESAREIGLTFLDVCDRHGLADHLYVDNGRSFASKLMTAGAKGRKRFKDLEGDPIGILGQIGVTVHFVTPAHGQAKPIERAFGDLANHISKHPAFEGAYLGNSPTNKPANYGTRTVTIAEVEKIVEQEVLRHNQRPNRRTAVCGGKLSFQEAFDNSMREHGEKVRRLTASQRRLLYLASDVVTVDRRDGCVKLFGNRYWTEELNRFSGRKVILRYHPTERVLHDAVYVYGLNGDFICEAPCYQKAGFNSAEDAERHTRARRQYLRKVKDVAKAERQLEAAKIAAMVPPPPLDEPMPLAAAAGDDVIRPAFGAPRTLEKIATIPGPAPRAREEAEARVAAALRDSAPMFDAMLKAKGQHRRD